MKLTVSNKEIELTKKDNKVWISTLDIAKVFEKRHDNILRIVNKRIEEDKKYNDKNSWYLTESLHASKLRRVEDAYILGNGTIRETYYYLVDRDIFNDLTLSFSGEKARRYRREFINAFNAMEKELLSRNIKVDELEHVRKAQMDISQYGTISKANKLHARVKQVRSYVRSDKNSPLSVLLGKKVRLTAKLHGLLDDDIKREIEILDSKIDLVADDLYREMRELRKQLKLPK